MRSCSRRRALPAREPRDSPVFAALLAAAARRLFAHAAPDARYQRETDLQVCAAAASSTLIGELWTVVRTAALTHRAVAPSRCARPPHDASAREPAYRALGMYGPVRSGSAMRRGCRQSHRVRRRAAPTATTGAARVAQGSRAQPPAALRYRVGGGPTHRRIRKRWRYRSRRAVVLSSRFAPAGGRRALRAARTRAYCRARA